MTHKFSGANVVQIYKAKIATIYHPNGCDFISYSKRDLNPHSRNGQGILSPSCLPIPPFEHPFKERAENETRTRDPNLGKVMLYQLSYFRNVVPRTGLEPACLSTHAPETCASTIPPPGQIMRKPFTL